MDVESIISSFTHPVIPPIRGMPGYPEIKRVHIMLNANASSIFSPLGNGTSGLLALTISLPQYFAVTGANWMPPANPGMVPLIPINADGAAIKIISDNHRDMLSQWKTYTTTDKALRQQLIGAIESLWLSGLTNRLTGYGNIPTKQILSFLYCNYGRITEADLV